MRIKTIISDRYLKRRLKRIERDLGNKTGKAIVNIGEWTKYRAKYYAPRDTGKTRNGVMSAVVRNTKGYKEVIVGFKKNPHPEKAPFNLPLWMHTDKDAEEYVWRNGKQPKFLNLAAQEARSRFRRKVDGIIKETVLKR